MQFSQSTTLTEALQRGSELMPAQQRVPSQKNLHFGDRQGCNLTAQKQVFGCWYLNTPWIKKGAERK